MHSQQCTLQLLGMHLFWLTTGSFAQLDKYYQAGTIVGGMSSSTGRRYYACPPGFLRMANSCYWLSTTVATWREAHFQCRDLGAQLAAFERPWEDKTVRRFLNRDNLQPHERWIGASFDTRSHGWIWAAKAQPMSYKSFPRRLVTRDWSWHCLALDPVIKHQWRPRPCMRRIHFLCEMPLHCVVGPVDGVSNSTTPLLITGSKCEVPRRSDLRHRRPGFGRRTFGTTERPRRPYGHRPRIAGPHSDPEDRERRVGGRRRERIRQEGRGRNRNRFAGSGVEHQRFQDYYTARPFQQGIYTDERSYAPRGILSNIERRRNERINQDYEHSKILSYMPNEIPMNPHMVIGG